MTDKELAEIEEIFKMASSKSFENDVMEARRIVLNSPRIPALLAHIRELRAAADDAKDLLFAECENYFSSVKFCNREVGSCDVLVIAKKIAGLIGEDDINA